MNASLNGGSQIVDKGEKIAESMKDSARRTAAKVEDAAAENWEVAQDRLQQGWKGLSKNAHRARETSEDFIRQKPLYAVLGAAAFGALVGFTMGMSQKKSH